MSHLSLKSSCAVALLPLLGFLTGWSSFFLRGTWGQALRCLGRGGGGIREVAYVRVSLRTNIAGLGLHLSRETIEDSELKSFNF